MMRTDKIINLVICFLLLTSFGVYSVSLSPGSYSFFGKKLQSTVSEKVQELGTYKAKDYGKTSDNKETFELGELEDPNSFHQIFNRILSISDSLKEKYARIQFDGDVLMVSLWAAPFGWKHFFFLVALEPVGKGQTTGTIELLSPKEKSGFFSFGIESKLRIQCKLNESKRKIQLTSTVSSTGLSKTWTELLVNTLERFFRLNCESAIDMARVRRNQLNSYKKISQEAEVKAKKLRLDRVINPDKYKHKSATVRRTPVKGSGGGRYTPSAATQARRQVKSG